MSDVKQGLAARLLSPVAEVRRGEAGSVLLMALTMMQLRGSYYNLTTAREALILSLNTGLVVAWLLIVSRLRTLYREREQPPKAMAA